MIHPSSTHTLHPTLQKYIEAITKEFDLITMERKKILHELSAYVQSHESKEGSTNLIFICTHNSRRSHIAQVWAQTAAYLYGFSRVVCYSGGTEATAFNPRAVEAMREAGFNIEVVKEGSNPLYAVTFSNEGLVINVFSKAYDHPSNAASPFAAIMTCSHADENCPFIPGADKRIALTYDDPKDFDGTSREKEKYAERVREIGREILYAFQGIHNSQ